MSDFDPIRALKEEITGLVDVAKTLSVRERALEQKLGETEAEHNAVKKLAGFAKSELDRKRAVLEQLIAKQERGET